MAAYVILSRFSADAFTDPKDFRKLAETVSNKIKSDCPGIVWKDSFATLGRFDVVDIVETGDPWQIENAAIRRLLVAAQRRLRTRSWQPTRSIRV